MMVCFSAYVFATRGAVYDTRYRYFTSEHVGAVVKATPLLIDLLQVPPPTVIFRPIRARMVVGYFQTLVNQIEIDPRRSRTDEVLETLTHEFIHAQQWASGKLRPAHGTKGKLIWDGEEFDFKAGSKYNHDIDSYYKDFPWEADVQERLPGMKALLMERMGDVRDLV